MELSQDSWRGKLLNQRKDIYGKYIAMISGESLLYIPIPIQKNSKYKITIEAKKESGNGIFYCNIYGNNKNFDFPQCSVVCGSEEWSVYDVELIVTDFPKTSPMVLRFWRNPNGTGSLLIRKILFEYLDKINSNEINSIKNNFEEIEAKTHKFATNVKKINSPARVWKIRNKTEEKSKNINNKISVKKLEEKDISNKQTDPDVTKANKVVSDVSIINAKYIKYYDENVGNKKVLFFLVNMDVLQDGLEKAFIKNGFQLCSFDFLNHHKDFGHADTQKTILRLAESYKPDWIHMILQFYEGTVEPNTIVRIKKIIPNVIITNWSADVRNIAMPYFVEIGKKIDKSLLPSEGQIDLYKKAGCSNVEYWQVGLDTDAFYRVSDEEREKLRLKYKHDIIFVANKTGNRFLHGPIRDSAADFLRKNFCKKFGLYGVGWPKEMEPSYKGKLNFYEQNEAYNGSKIVISINNFNNIRKYFSNRQLIAMATGTLVISSYVPGLEEYFENYKDLVWFYNLYDFKDIINYYSSHLDEADIIGKSGAEKVKNEHSYFVRVKELATRLGFTTK